MVFKDFLKDNNVLASLITLGREFHNFGAMVMIDSMINNNFFSDSMRPID